jgi:hypothetical protein
MRVDQGLPCPRSRPLEYESAARCTKDCFGEAALLPLERRERQLRAERVDVPEAEARPTLGPHRTLRKTLSIPRRTTHFLLRSAFNPPFLT